MRDVNTVKELSDILLADIAALVNEGAGERDILIVAAFEDDLVLEGLACNNFDSVEHLNFVDLRAAKEVLELDALAILGNAEVDGEVSVYESHFVLEAL